MDVERYLEDLEARIEPEVEETLLGQWRGFCEGRGESGVFRPRRVRGSGPRVEWPKVAINAAQGDLDALVLEQFGAASRLLAEGGGRVMIVRANYGTPILAMPFGAELFLMPEETNTLPASHPLGTAGIKAAMERGTPTPEHPYLQKVYAAGRRFAQIARTYPKIGQFVAIYHPDLQSPMDVAEMVWGSEIFEALVEEPETVHRLLAMVTELYSAVLKKWAAIAPLHFHGMAPHWGLMHQGAIMLRQDSAMNLSPAMYEEFIQPYDARLLKEFGGGAVHACGKVDHFVKLMAETPGVHAFNMTQPHLNNMEAVWKETVDRGINLIGFEEAAAEKAMKEGRPLRGRVHVE